jgi:3-phosphoshikimate 1-carboxyvinyltransferase
MDFFDEVFPQLGVQVKSSEGKLPLKIKGPLQPANITIDGSLSSQFLTGLLFAYAAVDAKDVTIKVTNLKSKPYVDLTLKVMKDFGLKIPLNKNYEEFYFSLNTHYSPLTIHEYTVEGDWSGGAFLLVAGAIAGNIIVKGLDIHSAQADKKSLEAIKDCGTDIIFKDDTIKISNSSPGISGFHFDATDCPDLFPPLAALAAYCEGITVIEGVNRLTHKESNRAVTIQEELGKMNLQVALQDNRMLIHGGKKLQGGNVSSRHDHRIAMMCAVAALRAEGETTIDDAEAVNKSYPDFYKHLQSLSAKVNVQYSTLNVH